MRLDPALQKFGRHGQARDIIIHFIEFETSKPRIENIFAQFGAKATADTLPSLGIIHGNGSVRIFRSARGMNGIETWLKHRISSQS